MMFTSNKVSKSMLDAVAGVLAEEEVQPKKKLILEPEKPKVKVEEEDEKKAKSPFDWKNTPRTTLKPGERTGHEHKKTSTGNVFLKKYKKGGLTEEGDCVTEPKAKEIAKKEVKGHEKSMHHEEVEQIDELSKSTLGKYYQAAKQDNKDYADSRKSGDPEEQKWAKDRYMKRSVGMVDAKKRLAKEDVEQIDELSKSTLGSYVKSAARDVGASRKLSADFQNQADKARKPSAKAAATRISDKFKVTALKRHVGIGKAVERLTKEDFSIESFMAEEFTEEQLDEMINEVLSKSAKAGDWIHDFVHSDNPKFSGKSKEKRKQMALAAYYAKQRNEEVEQMDEVATLGDYGGMHTEDEVDPSTRTTDTLKGRVKGGKHNQHFSYKVNLKAEEAVDEMKRPLDGDTFVTNEESPLKLAKDIAKKSFRKIRQETMMGKAGATSEETENE